jgi:transposase
VQKFHHAKIVEDKKASLQSKRGRKEVLNTLKERGNGLAGQSLFNTIERLEADVKEIEDESRALTAGDRVVELLMTIPGYGEISAWTIRAYADDIKRFSSPKKYSAYAGLVPWVQNSNETARHGKITKMGPEELRTEPRRMKTKTRAWRLTQRYVRGDEDGGYHLEYARRRL